MNKTQLTEWMNLYAHYHNEYNKMKEQKKQMTDPFQLELTENYLECLQSSKNSFIDKIWEEKSNEKK